MKTRRCSRSGRTRQRKWVLRIPDDVGRLIIPDPTLPGWVYRADVFHLDEECRFRCASGLGGCLPETVGEAEDALAALAECEMPYVVIASSWDEHPVVTECEVVAWRAFMEAAWENGAVARDLVLVGREGLVSMAEEAGRSILDLSPVPRRPTDRG